MNGFNILCLLLWVTLAHGHSRYRNIIPNGHYVKHPCKFGESWPAVGHMKSTFSPDFNAFGLDLKAAPEKRWTRALCEMDSDGDGLTNGQELGDPYCTWVEGQPAPDRYQGHPGFCEENRQSCRSCKIPTDCKYGNKYGCDKQGQSQNNRTRGRGREHTPMNINPTRPNQQNMFDSGIGSFGGMRPQDTGSFGRIDRFGNPVFGRTGGAPSFSQEGQPGRFGMTMSPGGFNGMGVPSGIGIPDGIGGPSRNSRPNFMGGPTGMGNPSGIGGQSRMSETFGLQGMGFSQSGFPSSGSAGTGGSPGGFSSPSFNSGMTGFDSRSSSASMSRPGFTPPREGPGFISGSGGPGFTSGSGGPGFASGRGGPGFTSGSGGPGFTSGSGGPGFTRDFGMSGTNHHQLPFTGSMSRSEIQRSVQDSMRRVGGMPSSTFPGSSGSSRGMSGMSMVPRIPGVFMGPMTYPF